MFGSPVREANGGLAAYQFAVTLCQGSGGGEIRTREHLSASPVFKTGAIGRSATPPVAVFPWFLPFLKNRFFYLLPSLLLAK
jgi:hypothetical protein